MKKTLNYYCTDCDRFLTRSQVLKEMDEDDIPHYICINCKGRTVKANKIWAMLFRTIVKKLDMKGDLWKYE